MKRHIIILSLICMLVFAGLQGCSESGYRVTYVYAFDGIKNELTGQSGVIPEPEIPERYGYSFDGWEFTDSDGTRRKWDFGTDEVTRSVTLTAVWTPYRIEIKIDTDGGTDCPDSIAATYGEAIKIPEPVKPGYTFMGWTYSEHGDAVFSIDNVDFTSDISITAVWLPFDPDKTLKFGRFVQDGDGEPEPVEWLILDHSDGKYLLISKKILYAMTYGTAESAGSSSATYQNSGIRSWLNNDFYNAAFTASEKSSIKDITINDLGISDRVTLLSYSERAEYLAMWRIEQCMAIATEYAVDAGLSLDNNAGSTKFGWWWLRQESDNISSGNLTYPSSAYKSTGCGNSANKVYGIRPVICVDDKAF